MEKAVLIMEYLRVTQSPNGSYSHKGDLAIDIASLAFEAFTNSLPTKDT